MLEEREGRRPESGFNDLGFRNSRIVADQRLLLLSRFFLFLAIGLAAASFLGLFPYTSPIADDFCRGWANDNRNIFNDVVKQYRTLNPRWLTVFIHYIILPRINFTWMYGLVLAFLLLAQIYVVRIFIRTVLGASNRLSWALAVSGYIVWITSGPSVSQNLYWLTGGIEYQVPFIAMLLLFSLLCRDQTSRLISVFSVVLSFFIPALNELAGATLICIFITLCGVLSLERVGNRRLWLACLIAALISCSIVVASPGNKVRKADDFPNGWQVAGIPAAMNSTLYSRIDWGLNPILVSATALFILLPSIKRLRPPWTLIRPRYLIAAPLLIFSAQFLVAFVLVWLHTGIPPARVETWNHLIWSILWFLTVFAWTRNGTETQPNNPILQILFGFMLGISILFAQNTRDAVKDLLKRAPAWHRAQLRRLHTNENVSLVPALPESPRSFFDADITSDPKYWRNRCMARYLRIESIAVAPGPEKNEK